MKHKRRAVFQLDAPEAETVELRATFTGWETRRLKRGSGGIWKTWVLLAPGRYEYRFLADGKWVNDSSADAVPNAFGSENSVRTIL